MPQSAVNCYSAYVSDKNDVLSQKIQSVIFYRMSACAMHVVISTWHFCPFSMFWYCV